MSMIPEEVIDEVRDTADLVGIIGETVELKRTGSDYRGPCPFHGGTHRNFAVIPRKRQFYCFVCKESGDIFSYFMKRFGMDYPTAVREVAQRSGITIPERASREGPDPNAPLFTALSAAQDWFTRQLKELPEAHSARDYLVRERGLELEAVEPFDLGYAPRGAGFVSAMTQLGLSEPVLLEAGLLVRREDGSIAPRFRGRLLFPIHDLRGRVVGFGGRLLGPGEPKYLNSPETPVFHKGSMLYNLHQAKQAIRKEGSVILVEGYFDVLRLVLAGMEHVVAPMGTALTPEQAVLLQRFAPMATLLLDSDTAGLRATFRAGDELLRHEIRVRVATMPAGQDPDTLVRAGGAAALEPILGDAIDLLERKIQILDRKGWFSDIEHRREALDRLLPSIRAAKDPITRELYLSLVAQRAGIEKGVLAEEVANTPPEAPAARPTVRPAAPRTRLLAGRPPEWVRSEQRLLEVLLHSPDFLDRARQEVRPQWFEATEYRLVFEALVAGASLPEALAPEAQRVWSRLKEGAANLGDQSLDQVYVEACQVLEARPLLRELSALDSRIKSAPEELKLGLAEEKRSRLRDLSTRFPETWARLHSSRKYRQETKTREPNA